MTAPISSRTSTFGGFHDDVYYSADEMNGYGALVDALLEYVPEMAWPTAGETLNRMRNDAQIAGSLRAYTLMIRRAGWNLDGSGCRPEVTAQISDDLGLPVLEQDTPSTGARRRRVVWSDHLRLALLDGVFGHMPFEQTYDTSTGVARLARLQERMPQTITGIWVDGDGEIDYVKQKPKGGQVEAPTIKRNALVWYVNDREGLGWRGRSLMRPSYPYWMIKDLLLRVHSTSIRRFGMGIPYAKAPAGARPEQIASANRAIANFKGGEFAGEALPDGFEMGLAGMQGKVPDALAFIKYLDQQISVSFLTQWLNLGTTETGARAIAEVFVDMFTQSIQDFGDAHADQATTQIVVPMVNLNWGEDEPAPRIVCGNVGANHAITAAALAELYKSGALSFDPVLENYIREMYKLPLRGADATSPTPPNGGTA